MKPRIVTALTLLALGITAPGALAAPGGLDSTFDGDGRRVFQVAGLPNEVLVQPDGRIVLAGYDANGDFAVWRLHPDGALDRGWDGDGTAATNFGSQDMGLAAALQPDGKVVAVGTTQTLATRRDVAIARFRRDGSLDPLFDPGGADGDGRKVIAGEFGTSAESVAIHADGRIVIVGNDPGSPFGLRRLKSDGSADGTTFEAPEDRYYDFGTKVALQADGKLLVAGATYPGPPAEAWQVTVARYLPDGKLDRTFAGTGVLKVATGVMHSVADIRSDAAGRILLAGLADEDDPRMVVLRFTAKGDVDSGFGTAGRATADFEGEDATADLMLQDDGTILLAGTTTTDTPFSAARFTPQGALDPGFGAGGTSAIGFVQPGVATAATLQPDGKLLIGGVIAEGEIARLAVARLLLDPDPPVAGGGGTSTPPPTTQQPPLRCAGRRATIVGTPGRDKLRGTRRADVIVALGGDDRVLAHKGDDLVCGGPGADRLSGGAGRDRLLGESGKDVLAGGGGRDRLAGGSGRDRCVGAAGRDAAAGCEARRSL